MRKLLLVAISLVVLCSYSEVAGLTARRDDKLIIIEGTILDISPILGLGNLKESGLLTRYRLVKYRVERVCKGKYKGGEMVIDHFVVSGDELKDQKVGDRVYALAWRRKKGGTIYTYKGIRESTEGLKYVYRGGNVLPAVTPSCSFDERKLRLQQ